MTAEPAAIVVLPDHADAAAIARKFVTDHSDHLPPGLLDDARLLVSEIVGNALRYGRPDVTLQVRLDPPGISVTVSDAGRDMPVVPEQPPDAAQPSGRGLLIVDAVASAWGVTPHLTPPGKTVWFELDA